MHKILIALLFLFSVNGMAMPDATELGTESTSFSSEPEWVDYWYMYIENECNKEIHAAAHYKTTEGNWITRGWWTIPAGGRVEIGHTRNRDWYLSAHTYDNSHRWEGSYNYKVNGTTYGFREKHINSAGFGGYTLHLHCN